MNRSIIASVALATALVIGCAKEKEMPAEIPVNTVKTADSLAQIKADSIVQASHDSIMRVDSMMQANEKKGAKKPTAKAPAKTAEPVSTPANTNPDGTPKASQTRPSRAPKPR